MPKPWVVKPLIMPVGDKEYTVEPIGYDDGLTLVAVGNRESDVITEESPDELLYKLCMGETWQQMLDDHCPYPVMVRAGLASIQYQSALINGLDTEAACAFAEPVWEGGIDPEALAALVAANPTTPTETPKTSKRSTSTASGGATRSRASSRATTSLTGTPLRKSTKAAPRSRGKASPSTSPSS